MFVNDIFKKKQLDEGGPFSYGAKKPRKGSVTDLAAQKRREQEKGKQPVEPRDQRVGVARVTKDLAEGRGNIEALRTELMGEYLNIYYNALDGWNMTDHIINLQDVYGRVKRSRDPVLQQTYNLLMDHAEESIDVQASAALKAIRILGDEPNYTPPPRPPMSPEDSARADAFVNQFLAALVSNGIKTHPDWQKNNDKGVAEDSGVTKLNDYNQWLDKVDAQGAQKHMQKNRTLIVAQSWDGEKVGEFDTSSNQGWVMTQGVAEGSDNIEQIKAKIRELEAEQEENKYGSFAYDSVDAELQFLYGKLDKIKKQGLAEGSAQDRLHKRHRELRKKSGLPDPDYYKELKASYDLPDEERYAKQKEIKQKYKVTNEDREQYIEELGRAGYEIVTEKRMTCPECGGAAYEDKMLAEKQDACYHKVKSRYKVWPSAYASGALVRCRKKGAKNWGNKSK